MTSEWSDPEVVDEVVRFYESLDPLRADAFDAAVERLIEGGPGLGRPTADGIDLDGYPAAIQALFGHRLKELRVGTIRILFTFGPNRVPVLLFAGDKAGEWDQWYPTAIREAAREYRDYLIRTGLG